MKHTIGTQTRQFEFIHTEFESLDEASQALYENTQIAKMVRGEMIEGLSDADFRAIYDDRLMGRPIQLDPGVIGQMSREQQISFNDLKKALVRTNK